MLSLKKEVAKCKHPNSRKTIALGRKTKKIANKDEARLGQMIKQNIVGEKIAWFKDNLPDADTPVFAKEQISQAIEAYLSRFDDELSQIEMKNSIGGRKNRQHASREDVIKMTKQRESVEYETCGIEIPDLMNTAQVTLLRNWNNELRFLQNFKLRRFNKKQLL